MYQFCLELKKNLFKGEIPLATPPRCRARCSGASRRYLGKKIKSKKMWGGNIKLDSTIYTPDLSYNDSISSRTLIGQNHLNVLLFLACNWLWVKNEMIATFNTIVMVANL